MVSKVQRNYFTNLITCLHLPSLAWAWLRLVPTFSADFSPHSVSKSSSWLAFITQISMNLSRLWSLVMKLVICLYPVTRVPMTWNWHTPDVMSSISKCHLCWDCKLIKSFDVPNCSEIDEMSNFSINAKLNSFLWRLLKYCSKYGNNYSLNYSINWQKQHNKHQNNWT